MLTHPPSSSENCPSPPSFAPAVSAATATARCNYQYRCIVPRGDRVSEAMSAKLLLLLHRRWQPRAQLGSQEVRPEARTVVVVVKPASMQGREERLHTRLRGRLAGWWWQRRRPRGGGFSVETRVWPNPNRPLSEPRQSSHRVLRLEQSPRYTHLAKGNAGPLPWPGSLAAGGYLTGSQLP